jgi:hypothetical protein
MTTEERLAAFLDGLSDEEHTFATRLLEMGADYPLVYVAIHLDRRLNNLSRPPWKGLPHTLGGVIGGILIAFLGDKGIR